MYSVGLPSDHPSSPTAYLQQLLSKHSYCEWLLAARHNPKFESKQSASEVANFDHHLARCVQSALLHQELAFLQQLVDGIGQVVMNDNSGCAFPLAS